MASTPLFTDAAGRLATRTMARTTFMALPTGAVPNIVGARWRANLGNDGDPDWWVGRVRGTCPVTRVTSIDWNRVRLVG